MAKTVMDRLNARMFSETEVLAAFLMSTCDKVTEAACDTACLRAARYVLMHEKLTGADFQKAAQHLATVTKGHLARVGWVPEEP